MDRCWPRRDWWWSPVNTARGFTKGLDRYGVDGQGNHPQPYITSHGQKDTFSRPICIDLSGEKLPHFRMWPTQYFRTAIRGQAGNSRISASVKAQGHVQGAHPVRVPRVHARPMALQGMQGTAQPWLRGADSTYVPLPAQVHPLFTNKRE